MSDEKQDDGGQAFPLPYAVGPNDDLYPAYPGMTLRDWFAGQSLAAMGTWTPPFDWLQGEYGSDEWHARARCERAGYAYAQADAMLAARK